MTHSSPARPVVVVLGGGYAGVQVARPLDDLADVVLVEPKDHFVHNVAALRALVDPSWLERIYLPYTGLLGAGRVIQDRAVKADADRVVLASGAGGVCAYTAAEASNVAPSAGNASVAALRLRWNRIVPPRSTRIVPAAGEGARAVVWHGRTGGS